MEAPWISACIIEALRQALLRSEKTTPFTGIQRLFRFRWVNSQPRILVRVRVDDGLVN